MRGTRYACDQSAGRCMLKACWRMNQKWKTPRTPRRKSPPARRVAGSDQNDRAAATDGLDTPCWPDDAATLTDASLPIDSFYQTPRAESALPPRGRASCAGVGYYDAFLPGFAGEPVGRR